MERTVETQKKRSMALEIWRRLRKNKMAMLDHTSPPVSIPAALALAKTILARSSIGLSIMLPSKRQTPE